MGRSERHSRPRPGALHRAHRRFLGLACFCLAAAECAHAETGRARRPRLLADPHPGEVCAWDDAHQVFYEPIDVENSALRRHVLVVEGRRRVLEGEALKALDLGHVVRAYGWRDADSLWIVSRVGHLADSAVLLDPRTLEVRRSYRGGSFSLSPDAKHVAYDLFLPRYYGYPGTDPLTPIFIDELMVHPRIVDTRNSGRGRDADEKKGNATGLEWDVAGPPPLNLVAAIHWDGGSGIEFGLEARDYLPTWTEDGRRMFEPIDGSSRLYHVRVEGLEALGEGLSGEALERRIEK